MNLPVTILYGSLSILVTLLLATYVSLHRMSARTYVTPAVPDDLHRKVRAHGNATEYLAAMIFLLAFLELQGVPPMTLHILGGLTLLSRIAHSIFMLTKSKGTMIAATATYILGFTMTLWALVLRLH
jgi:uncharacterized protein